MLFSLAFTETGILCESQGRVMVKGWFVAALVNRAIYQMKGNFVLLLCSVNMHAIRLFFRKYKLKSLFFTFSNKNL